MPIENLKEEIQYRVDELIPLIQDAAKQLKEKGEAITVESIMNMIRLDKKWENYKNLERDIRIALEKIQQEKKANSAMEEAQNRIEEFKNEARQYWREIEQDKKEAITNKQEGEANTAEQEIVFLVEKLRAKFLKNYVLENGKDNLIKLSADSAVIGIAIENVLKEVRELKLENIVASWKNKLKTEYEELMDMPAEVLINFVYMREYAKGKGEAAWMIDSKYVRLAAHSLVITREDAEREAAEGEAAEK